MREHIIGQFPHCDQRVLHAPGECEYCDRHPEWQELRDAWGIAYTGHSYDKNGQLQKTQFGVIQPCPAEAGRGMESINSWGGNVPMTPELSDRLENEMKLLTRQIHENLIRDSVEEDLPASHRINFSEEYPVDLKPTGGRRVTLSGQPADPTYAGGAPQPINPESGQHKDYWVLAPEELAKGFVRPVRTSYKHLNCGTVTTMGFTIAETYARDPKFYGATFCCTCGDHFPVGEDGQFIWLDDGSKVGT
jgi:hypothetical protein